MNSTFISGLALTILNYLLGSISFAILISKARRNIDIRKIGHRSAGGTNVLQNVGKKWGVLVGLLDTLKGIPLLILAKVLNIPEYFIVAIALAPIIGHCWPLWFRFSGGRGIATFVGAGLVLNLKDSIFMLLVFSLSFILKPIREQIYTKYKIKAEILSSAIVTLLAIGVFILLLSAQHQKYTLIFAILSIFILLFRRVTARFAEYRKHNVFKLFLSRLFFDNSESIR